MLSCSGRSALASIEELEAAVPSGTLAARLEEGPEAAAFSVSVGGAAGGQDLDDCVARVLIAATSGQAPAALDALDPDSGAAPLHRAVHAGREDLVHALLLVRADASVLDRKGKTPLRRAYDSVELSTLLLQARADPGAADWQGDTALHRAAEVGHCDVGELLLAAGANPGAPNEDGSTPAHEAACFGQAEFLRLLVGARASLQARDARGNTPLHQAAYGGHAGACRALLELRADAAALNAEGKAALQCAEDRGEDCEALEVLRGSGAPA